MTRRFYPAFMLGALAAGVLLVGCSRGNKSFTLKGTVSYQGKPLNSGVVRLHMGEEHMAAAMIQPDGSFEATEVFPGQAKVTVERKARRRAWKQGDTPPGGSSAKRGTAPPDAIPDKYKDVNTSGLAFTLEAGKPLNIQLE